MLYQRPYPAQYNKENKLEAYRAKKKELSCNCLKMTQFSIIPKQNINEWLGITEFSNEIDIRLIYILLGNTSIPQQLTKNSLKKTL